MRRYSWLGVLLLALLSGSALAGKAGKVRKQIAAGDYAQAAESGRAWLEKHPEDSEVALLVAQADYLHATELNTMEAYEAFLSSWRSSPFHERVHEQMAHLAFAEIEAYPSIEGWQGFRRLYPGSSLVPESLSREEDLAWTDARQEGTAEGYAAFLEAYPSGRFRQAAEDREAELVWAAVVRADSLDGYMAFLRDYPHSDRVEEARVRSEDLAWDRAKRDDAIQTWRDFRHSYQGERAERAYDRELELSWTGALVHHEIPTYRSFELDYPETDEALLAEDREWDLYHYEREPYPGELRPSITRARRQEDGSYELWFDVIDAEGALVGGLHEEHFTVYDAGYEGEVVELLGMEHNRPVDVVFVVDISGSMSDEIDGVKAGIQRFASIMQLRSRDMRLGLVTFIEEIFTVNGVSGSAPLTANVPAFQRWVDRIDTNARGSEEDHLMALDRAAGLNFRKGAQKVLVLLSDEDATLRKAMLSLETTLSLLQQYALRELAGEDLTAPQMDTLRDFGEQLRGWTEVDSGRGRPRMAHVVTIGVDAAGQARQDAVGDPMDLLVVVARGGETLIARGAAHSYYELTRSAGAVLNDDSWQRLLAGSQAPTRPAWIFP